jgi:hypothetical protein
MPVYVRCTLILQAADASLGANDTPASGVYPNRVLTSVPPELSALVASTSGVKQIPVDTPSALQTLASQLAGTIGQGWSAETNMYSSGSIWRSGEWVRGAGFSYRLTQDGVPFQEPLAAVGSQCLCNYLVFIEKLY